jgi:DNA-binding response OmpR family regulator
LRERPLILLVDDDRQIVQAAALRCKVAGYETVPAHDGAAGLKLVREKHPDAVVLDIRLPAMNGMDVLKELQANESTRGIPVIMLSASVVDQREAVRLGARYFLEKPYNAQKLLAALRELAPPAPSPAST